MTHTLLRLGTPEDRKDDYPWLITPREGVNDRNLPEKLEKVVKIIEESGIQLWGFGAFKNSLMAPKEKMLEELKEVAVKRPAAARLRGVCTSKEQLKKFIMKYKEADVGISLTVSGIIEDILEVSKELGIKPHSINLSLGVWGKKELLPAMKVLEVTTMCGHSLVSPRFVQYLVNKIKKGEITPKAAALLLARQCPCGIFNVVRTERKLKELAEQP